jgi:sucrose-6F-phosphate phosphohydrolase
MVDRLLLCTDLDRTLIPNGKEPESADAREHFAVLVARPEVTLAYVSGRHRALVEQAISEYALPLPDFVVGDVGTTIYHVGSQQEWQLQNAWEDAIAQDWNGKHSAELETLLHDISTLKLQEAEKQNRFKLSYYVNLNQDQDALTAKIQTRLQTENIKARLVWSHDEAAAVDLLDVLPARASKYHALEALMQLQGFDYASTVFSGDSGNDLEVLASPIPAVLVANAQPSVRELASRLASEGGHREQLYIAQGNFMGMNGNYSAGILEGVTYYQPQALAWMGFTAAGAMP